MTFKYPLLPLLKRDRFEGKTLSVEARRAGQVLAEKEQLYELEREMIRTAEAALRESYQQEQSIDLGKREVLQTFLRYHHSVAEAREKEATKARAVYGEVLGQLETKRLEIRTLEKHEERKRREHDAEARRTDLKQADEAWLLRHGGGT